MPSEEIKIIIRKNGEIWVDLEGLEPQRIRHYKEIFEEVIGPIKGEITVTEGGGASAGVPLVEQEKETPEKKREQIKENG